jgi:hypothetical protein
LVKTYKNYFQGPLLKKKKKKKKKSGKTRKKGKEQWPNNPTKKEKNTKESSMSVPIRIVENGGSQFGTRWAL